ncbi:MULTISPECIES: hypothetical protein [Aeromicrobium]|uniref:hypothetical protein n=1 Tax=Aeromicrobium TaxID=2040 RepID=UPI002580B205|nr:MULTISPECIES: hypothetical protein [Aeromicrobium]
MTPPDRLGRAGWPVAWVLLALPLMWWTVGLLSDGWLPHGDTAVAAVRIHDVFGPHTPLLGMPSTGGQIVEGAHAHHPGPMQFQLLAPLCALSGFAPWALVVGSFLLLTGLLGLALAAASRAAGRRGWLTVAVVHLAMIVGVGAALVTPWNPWVAMFALGASVSAAWAVLTGHGRWWPVFVVVISLAAQSQLAIAPLALVLGLVTLGVSIALWRRGRLEVTRGTLVLALVLGLACWAAPLVEVVRNEPDNLDLLARIAGSGGGLLPAVLLAAVIGGLLWWTRRRRTGLTSGDPSSLVTWLWIGTLVLLASATRAGEGRGFYVVYGAAVPLTLLAWPVVGWALRSRHRRALGGVAVACALLALAFLPQNMADTAQGDSRRAAPVIRAAQAMAGTVDGPIVVETKGGLAWLDIGPGVYAALLADGHDVYFDARVDGEREDDFRDPRQAEGPVRRLTVHSHPGTADPPPEGAVVDRIELLQPAGATVVPGAERYVDLVLEER